MIVSRETRRELQRSILSQMRATGTPLFFLQLWLEWAFLSKIWLNTPFKCNVLPSQQAKATLGFPLISQEVTQFLASMNKLLLSRARNRMEAQWCSESLTWNLPPLIIKMTDLCSLYKWLKISILILSWAKASSRMSIRLTALITRMQRLLSLKDWRLSPERWHSISARTTNLGWRSHLWTMFKLQTTKFKI